jgi:hypothetical protein
MLGRWEEGFPVVAAIKTTSEESGLMYSIRTAYYNLVGRLTDVQVLSHFTGFGLYDRPVVALLKQKFQDSRRRTRTMSLRSQNRISN